MSERPSALRLSEEFVASQPRRVAQLLAGLSGLAPKTCARALALGAGVLRAEVDRLRIEDAAKSLGITLGGSR